MGKICRFSLYLTAIISIMTIFIFYPDSKGELFPLFTDFTTLFIFLPAYFYFFCGILPLVCIVLFKNQVLKIIVTLFILTFSFINSLNYLAFYSIQLRLLFDLLTILPTLLFWAIFINYKELSKISTSDTNN